jgi:hypothetical protein
MAREHLRAWAKSNNARIPTRMTVYRDGISESLFGRWHKEETADIRRAYNAHADEIEKRKKQKDRSREIPNLQLELHCGWKASFLEILPLDSR